MYRNQLKYNLYYVYIILYIIIFIHSIYTYIKKNKHFLKFLLHKYNTIIVNI